MFRLRSQQHSRSPQSSRALSEFLLHHTWSIRLLSPFVNPLKIDGDCARLEQELTLHLRVRRQPGVPKTTDDEELKDKEGALVHLFWVDLQGSRPVNITLGKTNADNGESGLSRKRRKLDRTQNHLIVDIKVQEETLTQLICCYPRSTENNGTKEIKGFDFILARGSKSSSDAVLSWLETTTGCNAHGSAFCPSVAHVAQATTRWTLEHLHWTSDQTKSEKKNRPTKPLVLTYLVPSGHAEEAGLESLSLTVPPSALHTLFNNIMVSRKVSEASRWDPSQEDENQIPILRALECFLRNNFCIYIENFSLIRASSSAGVLGCDGRCKPLSAKLLPEILSEIRFMVLDRPR